MGLAVGIDLGTTNTVAAAVRAGVAATLPDPEGFRLIPSVVSFHPSGMVHVGRVALDRRLIDASNTIYSVKRLIGRAWGSEEVVKARDHLPFELSEGPAQSTVVKARGESYGLPEISAFVLRHAKAVAEAALGETVDRAVITVPANFNDLQRAATKTAGRLAGLEVLRILNEPTAAALAYGPQGRSDERIAVFDLGGGTFDVTVLDLAGNVFEVLATAGDTALGGDDIDVIVAERMAEDLLKKHHFDARAQPMVFGRLRILAEQMKRELSARDVHTLVVDDLVPGERGAAVEWSFRMTRPELEWASLALVERTFRVCQQALDTVGIEPAQLDRIILVGGATRMPMVGRKVEQFFGRAPVVRINPDEVVALGAAIQASLLDRSKPRGEGPVAHPQISEDSVVESLPEERSHAGEFPGLPVVSAHLPVAHEAPAAREGGGPPVRPPPPRLPREEPAEHVAPPAPAPAAQPGRTQFLPGGVTRPLVFDVPSSRPPPAAAFDLPLPEPSRNDRAPAGSVARRSPASVAASPPPPARPAPLLIDVTPLSLGVETVGGYCDTLLDANTPVPCDRTRAFSTASDGQTSVSVRVAQGESKLFAENTFLGELQLSGLVAAPRGETQIAVTFEIDADGILNVRARDVSTGKQTAARIQLVGAPAGEPEVAAMQARQAAHPIAALDRPR
jgi:molecular chaperone DnaK